MNILMIINGFKLIYYLLLIDYFGSNLAFDGINLVVSESYNNPITIWNRIDNNNNKWEIINTILVPEVDYPWSATTPTTTLFGVELSISNNKLAILLSATNAKDCSSTTCFGRFIYNNYNLSSYSFNYNNQNTPFGQDIINDYFVIGDDDKADQTSNVKIFQL